MYYDCWFCPDVTILVSAFSLVWFLLGLLVGQYMIKERSGARAGQSGRPSRGDDLVEIYVGNLSYDTSERDLSKAFENFGKVASVRIIKHKFSGKSKGFGFVEMPVRPQAEAAIKALHSRDMAGRKLVVNEAKSSARDH
jgi:RNA recognition motif-containing protein